MVGMKAATRKPARGAEPWADLRAEMDRLFALPMPGPEGPNILAGGSLEEDRQRLQEEKERHIAEARGAIDELISGATAAKPVHALLIGSGEVETFRITSPDNVEGAVSRAEFRKLFSHLSRMQHEGKRPEIDVLIAPTRFEIRLTPLNAPDETALLILARTPEEAALLDRIYDESFDKSNNQVHINDMDAAAKIEVAAEILSSVYPAERVGKLLKDLAAETARETTGRAKEPPRLKWEKDAKPDEDPAHFALRAYDAEAKAGKLHRGVIYDEDRVLYTKLNSWLRSNAMPEGIDIPTKREWITRQIEAGRAKPAPFGQRPNTEEERLYETLRKRQSRPSPTSVQKSARHILT